MKCFLLLFYILHILNNYSVCQFNELILEEFMDNLYDDSNHFINDIGQLQLYNKNTINNDRINNFRIDQIHDTQHNFVGNKKLTPFVLNGDSGKRKDRNNRNKKKNSDFQYQYEIKSKKPTGLLIRDSTKKNSTSFSTRKYESGDKTGFLLNSNHLDARESTGHRIKGERGDFNRNLKLHQNPYFPKYNFNRKGFRNEYYSSKIPHYDKQEGGSVGNLVIISNNNNNNNIDEDLFDINELGLFISMNKNLTLHDLLNENIINRMDEILNKEKQDISMILKQDATKNLKAEIPEYKVYDLRNNKKSDDLSYTYTPQGNGGVVIINNFNNNNNQKIRKILQDERININNNNGGVQLPLSQEEINELLENAVIINNDNNNNNIH